MMCFIPYVIPCGLYSERQWKKTECPNAGLLCKAICNSVSIQTSVSAGRKKEQAGTHPCITCLYLFFTPIATEDKIRTGRIGLLGGGGIDFHSDILSYP